MLGCNYVLTTSHVCSCKRRRRVAGQRTLIKVQRTMREEAKSRHLTAHVVLPAVVKKLIEIY